MADWYCPNCDFKNRDSNKTCTSCGSVRPGAKVPKADVHEPVWICPNCNHKNSTDLSTCFSCGKPRYGENAQSGNSTRISGKTAFICIAAATVICIGAAVNGTNKPQSSVSSRPTVSGRPSYTTESTTRSYSYTPKITEESGALRTAKTYLAVMPFSHDGLVAQLEYEGYSHSEAVDAADKCGADWNEQAVLKAKQYLDYMEFSRSELVEQLEYEGFTHSQA